MIECSNDRLWYKKRKRFKKRKFFWTFIILIFLAGILFYYTFIVAENIRNFIADSCYNLTTDAVNKAILYSLSPSTNYENFIEIEKNNSGEITLIKANTYNVNLVSRKLVDATQNFLSTSLEKGIGVPLLVFSGIAVISGYGPEIILNVASVASVECEFVSEFNSAGINQTLHSIYIIIKSKVNLEIPLKKYKIENQSKVLVSEAVIVGKVPDAYLNGKLFE